MTNLSAIDKKLYRDHYQAHNWSVDRAINDFICEYKDCETKVKKCSLFIFFDSEEREFNYCIKHGLQELHRYKNDLDEFEQTVKRFKRRKVPC